MALRDLLQAKRDAWTPRRDEGSAEGYSAQLGTFRATTLREIASSLPLVVGGRPLVEQIANAEATVAWLSQQPGREEDAARQAGCVAAAFPWVAWCPCCNWSEWKLRGPCGHRACLLCHRRYHARKARQYREDFGPLEFVGYLTLTIPPLDRHRHTIDECSARQRELAKAVDEWFEGETCVALSYVHFSGESDPWTHHPHYNVLISSRGYDAARQRVVKIGPKWIEPERLKTWRNFLAWRAWGLLPKYVQGHWRYEDSEAKIGHALRYAIRSQGDGNDRARHHWTKGGKHMLRPLGMLTNRKRSTWREVNPWPSEDEKIRVLGPGEAQEERCGKCRSQVVDATHRRI